MTLQGVSLYDILFLRVPKLKIKPIKYSRRSACAERKNASVLHVIHPMQENSKVMDEEFLKLSAESIE